jgi:hypothetical protein
LNCLIKIYLPIPLLPSKLAANIVKKLHSPSIRLCLIGDLIQTYQGEINETNLASLLSLDPSVGPKVMRGGNVQRYELLKESRQGVDKYIDVKKYEMQFLSGKAAHTKLLRIGYQRNAPLDSWRRLIFAVLPSPSYCFDSISKEVAGLPAIHFTFSTPEPERTRLVAELKALHHAEKYNEILCSVEACLPKDAQGNFIAEQEKSDVVHDLLAFLAEQMLEMNKQKLAWRSRASWAGWRPRWGPRSRTYSPRRRSRNTTSFSSTSRWLSSRRTNES